MPKGKGNGSCLKGRIIYYLSSLKFNQDTSTRRRLMACFTVTVVTNQSVTMSGHNAVFNCSN